MHYVTNQHTWIEFSGLTSGQCDHAMPVTDVNELGTKQVSYRSFEVILRQRQSKLRGINFVISKYK